MVLLGIDPGFRFAGFSVIKQEKCKTFLLECGCLKMTSSQSIQQRVAIFYDFFLKKIAQWNVTHIALETPFLGKNAQNFLKLGYLRGILYLLAEQHNLAVSEFSPREVKQSVTGFGGASKEQVSRAVLQLFPRLEKPKQDDVTDALAVCLCGLWRSKNPYIV